MMGVNTRNMYSCLQKSNKLNKSHLVGQLLNSIHDARTHAYKIQSFRLKLKQEVNCMYKHCVLWGWRRGTEVSFVQQVMKGGAI